MRLPPGRARAFETAGKQGCDCVAWSRKRRTGFISRQGVYECPRPSSYAELWDKVSQTDSHTYEKADGFFSQNWNGLEAILGLSRLDCPSAKAGGAVNGGAFVRRSSWPLTGSAGFAIFPVSENGNRYVSYYFIIIPSGKIISPSSPLTSKNPTLCFWAKLRISSYASSATDQENAA